MQRCLFFAIPQVVVLTLALAAAPTAAQAPEAEPRPDLPVAEAEPPSTALLRPDPFDRAAEAIGYRALQSYLDDELNLNLELGYTLIFQAATDTVDQSDALLSGSYDIVVDWGLVDLADRGLGNGTFGMLVEGGQIISHNTDEDLTANVGSGLGLNDDLDNADIAVTELWYAHELLDGKLTATVGKIDQTVYIDANRIANDETAQFLATPLVNNSAIAFPDNGLGFNVTISPTETVYLTGGWGNAAAVATESTVNNLGEDEWFWVGELGLTPTFGTDAHGQPRDGAYRFIGWHVDTPDASGSGFALNFDQHIARGLVPFARYGYADADVSDLRHQLSAGLGLEQPFGRAEDLVAFGLVWADFHDRSLDDQTLVEAFYRIQLLETMTLTPDVQIITNPAEGDDPLATFALRAQWTF